MNYKRFAEAQSTGADTVAVACPYCPIMLKDAAGRAGSDDTRVADVAQLVAGAAPEARARGCYRLNRNAFELISAQSRSCAFAARPGELARYVNALSSSSPVG